MNSRVYGLGRARRLRRAKARGVAKPAPPAAHPGKRDALSEIGLEFLRARARARFFARLLIYASLERRIRGIKLGEYRRAWAVSGFEAACATGKRAAVEVGTLMKWISRDRSFFYESFGGISVFFFAVRGERNEGKEFRGGLMDFITRA